MTDIDAPARYAEPAADQTGREGNVGLVVALALGLAVAAVGLAMISREMAEPFVLAILGGLAVIGVFCLFAGAVGILHFGQSQTRNDVTKAFVDNLPQGALVADQSGRVLYANEAYRSLLGLEPWWYRRQIAPLLATPISPNKSSACRAPPNRAGRFARSSGCRRLARPTRIRASDRAGSASWCNPCRPIQVLGAKAALLFGKSMR
jgi:PAS fold